MEVFVPNQNSWNQYTMQAATHLGYSLISASTLPYSGMTYNLTTSPLKMPQQTTTGYIGASEAWVAYHQNQTVADCVAADARGEVCVIMMHPHEFASGAYTLTMLSQLMDMLFAAGFESTNFHQIIMEAKGLTNSPTAAPTQKVQSTAVPSAHPTQAPSVSNSLIKTLSPTSSSISKKRRFIVRLDDMEDWNHSDIQVSLLNFFMNNSIAVTAGIIGNFFTGADVPLYNTLTRCANLGKDKCALFNHGADAVYLFGNSNNVSNQVAQMKICDDR
eukprot:gene33463-42973_t